MSAKKQTNWSDAIRDAATGYAVVVLGVICFLLALAVVVAGVRMIVGTSAPASGTITTASANMATGAATSRSGTG